MKIPFLSKIRLASNDLGIDLGTCNVLIYLHNKGIVLREPSVVAVDKNTGKILQVGAAARNMLGRTPGNVVAMHPLHEGVISDHELTVKMLQELFRNATKAGLFNPKPRVVISVPSNISEVQERTVINAALEAGARRVYLIEEPLAAGLGAGLNIQGPIGHMIVDMGGGTSDIAVLTMNGVANSASSHIAGDFIDETIVKRIRRKYNIVIGKTTAENIKIQIGTAIPRAEEVSMIIKGRDAKTGTPREIEILSSEIYEFINRQLRLLADEVRAVLEDTSPELAADISENGITLTGGFGQLLGMDALITEVTGIQCHLADDPDSCVAYGCGKSLNWIHRMNEGPINIARKRIMNS